MVTWWLALVACSGPSGDGSDDGPTLPTGASATGETGTTPGDDDDDTATVPTADTSLPFVMPKETRLADLVCPDADLTMLVEIDATQVAGPGWVASFPLDQASCQPGVLTSGQLAAGRAMQEASCLTSGLPPAFCADFALDVSDWLDTFKGLPGVVEFNILLKGPWELDDVPAGAVAGVGWDTSFFIAMDVGTEWWVTSPTAWGVRYNYVSPTGEITSQGSRHFTSLKFTPVPETRATCQFQTDNLISGQILSPTTGELVYDRPTRLACTWTDGLATVDIDALITYTARLHDTTE